LLGENARHLSRVLRARIGQVFDIVCDGEVRQGTVISVAEDRVEFELGEQVFPIVEAPPITLLLAVFKFDRFEWAIEKLTEIGVAEIVPVIAARTESHFASSAQKRVERWRRIAHEAAQQSRRDSIPQIADPVKLTVAVERFTSGTRLLLDENEPEKMLGQQLVSNGSADAEPLALAVGPEGGWTSDEVAAFHRAGWLSVTLGPTILRAETAAIAAAALAIHLISTKKA